jgi:hypothetical protein
MKDEKVIYIKTDRKLHAEVLAAAFVENKTLIEFGREALTEKLRKSVKKNPQIAEMALQKQAV